MSVRQTVFHGYRGTTKFWGDKCKFHNEFTLSTSPDEYFGYGIYFFENDQREAYNFARYARRIPHNRIRIIYALIETDRVLDFFESRVFENYIRLIKDILDRYKDEEVVPDLDLKNPFDCRLINDICERENYLLVKTPYTPQHQLGILYNDQGYTRIKRTHIQLCVRDISIIKEHKVFKPMKDGSFKDV